MHVGISLEPAVVLGLMGIEVVENDMEGGITIDSDDVVHEVEKLNAAATPFVSDSDLSGGNLEGSKQGRSAVTRVVEKLNAAATPFVSDSDLSGGNLEGSKQGRSAVTLVDAMGRAARYAILGAAKVRREVPHATAERPEQIPRRIQSKYYA